MGVERRVDWSLDSFLLLGPVLRAPCEFFGFFSCFCFCLARAFLRVSFSFVIDLILAAIFFSTRASRVAGVALSSEERTSATDSVCFFGFYGRDCVLDAEITLPHRLVVLVVRVSLADAGQVAV